MRVWSSPTLFLAAPRLETPVILNIGLAREGRSNIGPGTAMREVQGCFHRVDFSLRHSDTEMTVIAVIEDECSLGSIKARVHHLCLLLGQDCIAAWDGQRGALIGPRADKWGAFNPDFFLLPSGERLQPAVA